MKAQSAIVDTVSIPRPSKSFRELYEDRLMEDFPQASLEEIEDMARDGESVSAYFGSSGYEIYPDNIESYMHVNIFTRGYCVFFAHLYAQKFGHDKFLLVSKKKVEEIDDGWTGHILVELRDGVFVDADGVNSVDKIESQYSPNHYSYETVSENDLWARKILIKEQYSHPLEFVDEFEQEFTHRFVESIHNQVE